MRILIVRHGDPDYANDCLTEKGRVEAALLADKLEKEKLDYFYSSPMGRARETCETVRVRTGKTVEVLPWLREFDYAINLPTGEKGHLIWDQLPRFLETCPDLYDREKWLELPFMKEGGIPEKYKEMSEGLDGILARHGYRRKGRFYEAVNPNRDTLVFFCHFGLGCCLLGHLLGFSPVALAQSFVGAPTSVTTLYTEERRKGEAMFRCGAYGDISHLYAGGEAPSFSARFCETFDSDERHD